MTERRVGSDFWKRAGSLGFGRLDSAGRRGLYFAFQGLLMAVLLLIFLYQYRDLEGWMARFSFLMALMGGSLVFLKLVPDRTLLSWFFQMGLFVGDAVVASLILYWTRPSSDLYLLYFLIIFGTALIRSLAQSLIVALVTSGLYMVSAWNPLTGLPHDSGFWLRVNLLWVSSALLAILSRDSSQAQMELGHKHQERMVQFERLATLGQLAGEVAHRIKGPLTTIMVNAEVLSQSGRCPPEARRELDEICAEVGHCRDILKNLLDLGRIEEMDRVKFDLRAPVKRALELAAPRVRQRGLRLLVSLEEPLPVVGDPSLIQEAVVALLHNAIDSVRDGGRISVAAASVLGGRSWLPWLPRPRVCEVSIKDDGRGIDPANLERIFQPFFTTKGTYGSGLGLSAALRVLQKHGGSIDVYSDGAGKGARFVLSVPCQSGLRRLQA